MYEMPNPEINIIFYIPFQKQLETSSSLLLKQSAHSNFIAKAYQASAAEWQQSWLSWLSNGALGYCINKSIINCFEYFSSKQGNIQIVLTVCHAAKNLLKLLSRESKQLFVTQTTKSALHLLSWEELLLGWKLCHCELPLCYCWEHLWEYTWYFRSLQTKLTELCYK